MSKKSNTQLMYESHTQTETKIYSNCETLQSVKSNVFASVNLSGMDVTESLNQSDSLFFVFSEKHSCRFYCANHIIKISVWLKIKKPIQNKIHHKSWYDDSKPFESWGSYSDTFHHRRL